MIKANTLTGIRSGNDVAEILNPAGSGDFLIVCEHASHFIPPNLNNLGLDGDVLKSHIAWDPGALSVAAKISVALDAPLVAQRVSRLVYDCNRPLEAESAIPAKSERYQIPGNIGLTDASRRARHETFYLPFRDKLTGCLQQKIDSGYAPALVTVHSFTPVYQGRRRDVEIGVLHDADSRLADSFLKITEPDAPFIIRRNEPYGPADGVTHTLAAHAMPRGLLNVMFEIRNDLITDETSQRDIATWLSENLLWACNAAREAAASNHQMRSAQ
ncbi:MAG: N-formylglutamate amidohydrolase [Fimbriimonadaceae bacterium]|nr:N-formylglutamate amidohydrolase [Alphaproteobacteria bacterium]